MEQVTLYAEYLPASRSSGGGEDEQACVLMKFGQVAIDLLFLTEEEDAELLEHEPGSELHDRRLSLVGARWLSSRLAMRW